MIPKECKRLAEVDFPIAVVSKHSVREKPIVSHHPQSFHQWWARRPLAACRAMLLALLLPDPCDPHCPKEFKEKARELLAPLPGKVGKTDEDLRKALLRFIGDFADWDCSTDPVYLEVSRALVKAAHGDEPPLVVDPFAGGGSIPLEALRVGCDTFASDLNPVACLILKVMLEDIPRYGREKIKIKRQKGQEIEIDGLAEALRIVGKDIKEAAEKELKEFYPDDEDGAKPIAYLWARTVKCEAPNCGAEILLMRSFWLSKKEGRKRALRYKIVRPSGKVPYIDFEIFEPDKDKEVPTGTVARAKATCLCCNTVLPPERVRAQLTTQQGGADVIFDAQGNRIGGARMLTVVTLKPGKLGRHYRLPTEKDYVAVWKAQKRIKEILNKWEKDGKKRLCPVPDEPTPMGGGSGAGRAFSVQKYGMFRWGDLFTARQKVFLLTLATLCARSTDAPMLDLFGLVVSRLADRHASLLGWDTGGEKLGHVFNRQALPIVWDYAEGCPLADATGSYTNVLDQIEGAIQSVAGIIQPGQVQCADARENPLPNEAAAVWFTDPPYYDAVPYADLSDFFLVWLKRCLNEATYLRDPFDPTNELSPKQREIVQDETKYFESHVKDNRFFESSMGCTFNEGQRVLHSFGIGSVVFAHKTTEGWEALLSGMVRGGLVITGSWPVATERTNRLRSQQSAALATSIHLVCRPRPEDAPVGDWGDVLRELPQRAGDWMERLQAEGIRGADLVFACIGPALEIFSRYSKVETADGKEVTLAQYLEKVWEVVGRIALENVLGSAEAVARNGMAGALEEDARLTALFLWTLQSSNGESGNGRKGEKEEIEDDDDDEDDEEGSSKTKTKGFSLIFDVARRFAQPLGIHLPEWEGRIIETKKGIVRLLSVSERAEQLFGKEGTRSVAERIERSPDAQLQGMLFPEYEDTLAPRVRGRRKTTAERISINVSEEALSSRREATTLDRVHAAMLLQSSGQPNALRALLRSEHERGTDFIRLANALSALYPKTSEEKRLLDAMLLAYPK
ncbi:MAG TPA: DUF1156 domain-containing protein [Syntrophorhabdus sp.]|nr:DUF1156 domain-containing protein [Syntrophorhabdus sp.]